MMILQLPADLADPAARQELELASVAGGQDHMPYPTRAEIDDDCLLLARDMHESGSVVVPYTIPSVGRLMTRSATLIERQKPYDLILELARGKVNQLRSQAADWIQNGLLPPETLKHQIHQATAAFGAALNAGTEKDVSALAGFALRQAFDASAALLTAYTHRVLALRHERQIKFDTALSCRLSTIPQPDDTFTPTFSAVSLPFSWRNIERTRGVFTWEETDRLVAWGADHGLKLLGGPLIDFAGHNLPDWIWENATDLQSLSELLGQFVEAAVRRYAPRIRTWQVSAGSNCSGILARRDEELIWLTVRLVEAVRRVHPHLEVIVGIAQPWGDYLAQQERSKTPFIFADDLLRTGVKLSALDLEFLMSISPRGSYCRDPLELSRILDLYALLGVSIQATLGYPSSAAANEQADPDQRADLGWWGDGLSERNQAEWINAFASLALCKPYVRALQWIHWSDAESHSFPNCGLLNAKGEAKPALAELRRLREEHLK